MALFTPFGKYPFRVVSNAPFSRGNATGTKFWATLPPHHYVNISSSAFRPVGELHTHVPQYHLGETKAKPISEITFQVLVPVPVDSLPHGRRVAQQLTLPIRLASAKLPWAYSTRHFSGTHETSRHTGYMSERLPASLPVCQR